MQLFKRSANLGNNQSESEKRWRNKDGRSINTTVASTTLRGKILNPPPPDSTATTSSEEQPHIVCDRAAPSAPWSQVQPASVTQVQSERMAQEGACYPSIASEEFFIVCGMAQIWGKGDA